MLWQQEMSSYAGLGADINNVYVTSDFDAVVALDRQAGTQLWRQEALRLRDVTAPTRFANTLVVGDFEGYVHWLSPDNGDFLARERGAGQRISGAPLVVGENVYVQGDDGTVAAFTVHRDELRLIDTTNADNPLVWGHVPLLNCDLWEHAYYLDHRNERGQYLSTFLTHLVNWDFVDQQLAKGQKAA